MTDHLVPTSYCPECGIKLNIATHHAHQHLPEPGDFTVCISCMAVLRYADGLQLRAATLAERQEAGPDLALVVKGVQLAQLSRPDLDWGRSKK